MVRFDSFLSLPAGVWTIIAEPLEIPHGGELESRGVPVCSWRSDSGARARKIDEGKKQWGGG